MLLRSSGQQTSIPRSSKTPKKYHRLYQCRWLFSFCQDFEVEVVRRPSSTGFATSDLLARRDLFKLWVVLFFYTVSIRQRRV